MGSVHARSHGAFPPDVFVRALTDLGPGRSEIVGSNGAGPLQVHGSGDTWADVTEGFTRAATSGSGRAYRIDPAADGGSDVHVTAVHLPRTAESRLSPAP